MPVYEFKKDGDSSTYEIDAPDMATAHGLFLSGKLEKNAAGVLKLPDPPLSVLERVGSGMADPLYGGKQLYEHTAGTTESAAASDKMVREREAKLKAGGAPEGDFARSAGRTVPAIAGGIAAAPLTGGASLLGAAGGGAISEALNPVTDEDYWTSKTNQALVGGAGGLAGGALTRGAAGLLGGTLGPEARQLADAGVSLTPGRMIPGDITGRVARRAEDAFKSVPILGTFIRGAEGRSIESYNKAVLNQTLAPLGVTVPASVPAGHEAIDFATRAATRAYDDVLQSNPQLMVRPAAWPTLDSEIKNVQFMARSLAPNSTGLQFATILNDHVLRKLEPLANGQPLPALAAKNIDSQLFSFIKQYRGSANPDQRLMAQYLDDVRFAVRDALASTNPREAAALRRADEAYMMLTRVQDAAQASATSRGVFTPTQLLQALRRQDTSVRNNAFARGRAVPQMQAFSETAQRLLAPTLPDSGTTERALWDYGGGAGLAWLHPGALAGVGAAAVPYTRGGGAALGWLAQAPGPTRARAAQALRGSAGTVGTTAPSVMGMREESTPQLDLPKYEAGGRPSPEQLAVVGETPSATPKPELFVSDDGQATLVGQNGPQTIIPKVPGTVIPAEQTAAILAQPKSYYQRFVDMLHGVNESMDLTRMVQPPGPMTGSVLQDVLGSVPMASMGLKPSGIRLYPGNNPGSTPRLQIRGRFSGHTDQARLLHPAVNKWPFIASGQIAANGYEPGTEAPPAVAPGQGGEGGKGLAADTFAERWPSMPLEEMARAPMPSRGGEGEAGKATAAKPTARKSAPAAKRAPPTAMERLAAALTSADLSHLVQPVRRGYANGHYAEGGEPPVGEPAVVGDQTPAPEYMPGVTDYAPPANQVPLTRGVEDYETRDPNELAALRMREHVKPTAGRADFTPEHIAAMAQAAAGGLLAPEYMLGRGVAAAAQHAPKLTTAALALGGAGAATEAGGVELPKTPEEIRQLQIRLRDTLDEEGKPLYGGTIDGKAGDATRTAAIRLEKMEADRAAKLESERLRIAGENAASTKATASAQQKLAEAQLKKIEDDAADRALKSQQREAGNTRMQEVEKNAPWYRKYADYLGYGVGAGAGILGRLGLVKAYNRASENAALKAESRYATELPDTTARVARVNDFWRKGGAGAAVPFTSTPATAPGFAANPAVAPAHTLYQPSKAKNITTDVGVAGAGIGESLVTQLGFMPGYEEELKKANEAAAADPSEINIQRLQEAKDAEAFGKFMTSIGRGVAGGYAGTASKVKRSASVPNLDKAENEKLFLEEVLRKSADAKAISEKAKLAAAARKMKATSPVKTVKESTAEPVRTINIIPAGIPPASAGKEAFLARQLNGSGPKYAEGGRPVPGEAAMVGDEGMPDNNLPSRHMPPEVNFESLDSMINGTRVDQSKWATDADVARARRADAAYGTKAAGFTEPGISKTREIQLRDVPLADMLSFRDFENIPLKTTTPEQADRVYRQWLGAQKSPIAALGFDPHRTASSPQHKSWSLELAGAEYPKNDVMWYDRNHEDAAVHEAIHRGLEMLEKNGYKLPASSESLTRRIMMRNFGDLERRGRFGVADTGPGEIGNQQIDAVDPKKNPSTASYLDSAIDAIEAAAAKLYAQKGFNRPNSTANAPTKTIRGPQ